MTKDELVVSLVLGAVAALTIVLVWGRRFVDLVPLWAFGAEKSYRRYIVSRAGNRGAVAIAVRNVSGRRR